MLLVFNDTHRKSTNEQPGPPSGHSRKQISLSPGKDSYLANISVGSDISPESSHINKHDHKQVDFDILGFIGLTTIRYLNRNTEYLH